MVSVIWISSVFCFLLRSRVQDYLIVNTTAPEIHHRRWWEEGRRRPMNGSISDRRTRRHLQSMERNIDWMSADVWFTVHGFFFHSIWRSHHLGVTRAREDERDYRWHLRLKISLWDDMEVPSESFHWSSWDSRTCYPRRAFIQGLTDDKVLAEINSGSRIFKRLPPNIWKDYVMVTSCHLLSWSLVVGCSFFIRPAVVHRRCFCSKKIKEETSWRWR